MTDKPLPQHIAFIMDGNGRWATAKGLARLRGHAAGVDAVKRTIESLTDLGVPYATFYAFSSENWKRPEDEVSGLFSLMRTWFNKEMSTLVDKGIKVRFMGDRTPKSLGGRLSDDIIDLMNEVEAKTADCTTLTAMFAINYGGKDEIVRAAARLAAEGGDLTAERFDAALDTAGMPAPDLMIRTSGEKRLSNFMLWQLAYAEFYFTPVSWPDFSRDALDDALAAYGVRERRFGALPAASVA
ncbi:MAG: di-trans,poly-cis-decaprenylcistransferase [Alphaproteobacteria bacterium CG_4_10_14_0_8_um_filter_53_9]|nr:MAG: di-trans,poly-cis-decaprenylcistransferase [Alphaproteobacteria bacterium CG_4_10_14_0_8_um_filter_53_9]